MGRVPELRFSGFSGEWEEVLIGDVLEFGRSYSFSRAKLSDDGDVKYIHYGDIHKHYQHSIDFNRSILPTINSSELPDTPYYLKENDLIMADASEDYADTGKSAEVKNIGNIKAVAGLHTFVLRDKDKSFAPNYKGYMFYSPRVSKNMKRIATGISVLGISKGNLSKLPITVPSLPEQQKIADFLTAIDEIITLTTDKISQLETYKRGMMQKLLSGALRFPGFSGEWREVKLGEIVNISTGKSKSKFIDEDGKYFIVDMGAISEDGKLIAHKKTNIRNDFLEVGTLVMPKDDIGGGRIIGKTAIIDKKNLYIKGDHIYALQVKKDIDSKFLHYSINSYCVNKQLRRKATGTAQLGLNKKSVESTLLKIPVLLEQQKIADFLTSLDDKLTLEKEKLDQLKSYKQGLLQKMFV